MRKLSAKKCHCREALRFDGGSGEGSTEERGQPGGEYVTRFKENLQVMRN